MWLGDGVATGWPGMDGGGAVAGGVALWDVGIVGGTDGTPEVGGGWCIGA